MNFSIAFCVMPMNGLYIRQMAIISINAVENCCGNPIKQLVAFAISK